MKTVSIIWFVIDMIYVFGIQIDDKISRSFFMDS